MKNIIFILAITLMGSCKITSPSFKHLGQWQVSNVSTSQVTLSNTATFYNPNNIDGVKVNGATIEIQSNGKKLGNVTTVRGTTVPKLAEFSIPLSINVNVSDLIGNITDILGMAMGKTIDVRCVGNVQVGYSVINKSISFDKTLPVSLKDIKK